MPPSVDKNIPLPSVPTNILDGLLGSTVSDLKTWSASVLAESGPLIRLADPIVLPAQLL